MSHFIIWSRVPAISSANIPLAVQSRVKEEGLWGFTGTEGGEEPIPPPGINPIPPVSDVEEKFLEDARHEFHVFVKRRWPEDEWECAWFVNPPVSLLSLRRQEIKIMGLEASERTRVGSHPCICSSKVILELSTPSICDSGSRENRDRLNLRNGHKYRIAKALFIPLQYAQKTASKSRKAHRAMHRHFSAQHNTRTGTYQDTFQRIDRL